MRKMLIAAGTLALLGTALPAAAQDTVEVTWRDLDLASPEGQRKLDSRIDRAARKACGMDKPLTGTRIPTPESRECYQEARIKARDQVAKMRSNGGLGG